MTLLCDMCAVFKTLYTTDLFGVTYIYGVRVEQITPRVRIVFFTGFQQPVNRSLVLGGLFLPSYRRAVETVYKDPMGLVGTC